MTITDEILNEWSFRCHDGIVDLNDLKKLRILKEILEENGINLNEAIDSSVDEFSTFIQQKYLAEKQSISGLDSLYNAIQKSSDKDKLFSLIQSSGNKQLKAGKTSIQSVEGELFKLIMSFVKMQNGDPSELWFAIMYGGKAKGGVATEETGIESDVDVGSDGVSIKNYSSIGNLDFGSLPSEELKELKKITNLLVVLTGVEFTAGLSRNSLNSLLKTLNSQSFQDDLNGILRIGKDTQIKALQNMYNIIVKYLPNGDARELVDEFVNGINNLIVAKIKKVQWWAIISKNSLYLEPSETIANRLQSKEGQLSPVISQIKGNNLFINGNRLFSDTTEEQ
jgi:hypothetical protein